MAKPPSSPTAFYEALGLGIVQWSRVEDAMCDLFIRLTICGLTGRGMGLGRDKEQASSEGVFLLGNIFYGTTNFRGRLEMLDNMMKKLVTDDTLLADWNAIKNKSGKLYQRRNVLAHGAAWAGDNCDPELMTYSVFSNQNQQMDYQQITEVTPSFYNYAEKITQLAITVNKHLAGRKRFPQDLSDEEIIN